MMNKTELFRKVGGILSELNDQYEYIAANPGSLNELELELFSANADFLSEHTKILLKLVMAKPSKPESGYSQTPDVRTAVIEKPEAVSSSLSSGFNSQETEKEPTLPLPPISDFQVNHQPHVAVVPTESVPALPEITEAPLNETPRQAVFASEPQAPSAPVESAQELVIPEVVILPEPVKVVAEPVSSPEPVVPAKPVAEPEPVVPAAPRVQTLNEMISGQRSAESSVGVKFNAQPITDLKSGVSLNDKLLFIKELFNGYSLAYSEAIEILNRFDSFEAAEAFLKTNYAGKNNWESKHSTAEKFYDILRRRFS